MAELSLHAATLAADPVCRALDGGALLLLDASGVAIARLKFGDPAFGLVTVGTGTANPLPISQAERDGTPVSFSAVDSSGMEVFSGSAGVADADLILERADLRRGSRVQIESLTYTQRRADNG